VKEQLAMLKSVDSCPICYRLLLARGVQCPRGHVWCHDCHARMEDVAGTYPACPLCRTMSDGFGSIAALVQLLCDE